MSKATPLIASLLIARLRLDGLAFSSFFCSPPAKRYVIPGTSRIFRIPPKFQISCVRIISVRKRKQLRLRPTIMGSEYRNKQVLPLWCWNPHKALASFVLFPKKPARTTKKNDLFALRRTWLPPHESSSHRPRTLTNLKGACSTERKSPRCQGAWVVCVSRSLAWDAGAWPIFRINFLRYATGGHFRSDKIKKWYRNGPGSYVPSKTSRHRSLL